MGPRRPHVAIVGAGIAGLGAAWRLAPHARVTVLEAADWLGGHANTRPLTVDGVTHQVDTGFIVHNRRTYPELVRMFAELDVPTQASDMSMAVSCAGCGLEYAGRRPWSLVLGSLRRPRLAAMLLEVVRFQRRARSVRRGLPPELTLRDWVAVEGWSEYLVRHFLVPVTAAVWSAEPGRALDMPASAILGFLDNHGLLESSKLQWRTVTGGSRAYVERVAAFVRANGGELHTSSPVRSIDRALDGGVLVCSSRGIERFDHVVVATHADVSLELLERPTALEQELLGAFRYDPNRAVLHTDAGVLPRMRAARACWNYRLPDCRPAAGAPTMTYSMTRLQRLETSAEVNVTLNPTEGEVDPARVAYATDYRHPQLTVGALRAQGRLPELAEASAHTRTSFCGAWQGFGFHEDGLRSGLQAAEHALRGIGLTNAASPEPNPVPA